MRIGVAVPNLGFAGGIERYAHDLAVALAARGHTLTLLHGPGRGPEADGYVAPFARAVPTSEAARVARDLDVAYLQRADDARELLPFGTLPLAIAAHDHDLTCVRSHRYLPWSLEPCHRPPGMACVTHGCVVVRDRRPDAPLPIRIKSPFALRARLGPLSHRAALVANSRYVAANLVAAGVDPARVHVVHPVPPDDPRPPVARPRAHRLLVVGQLLRGKGVDLAIEAMRHLPPDTSLAVAGDGPSRESLTALAEEVAPGRVRFHGYVPPEGLGALRDEASVAVVPSRWPEPFGMVGIEAMRRARPVVGADHGGIPEWLEPGVGGLLFTPGSPRALADAALVLFEDAAAGERAYASATQRFPQARMVEAIETLLTDAVRAGAIP